jgi:hypothetical protein
MSINLKDEIKPISYIKTNAADMMKYGLFTFSRDGKNIAIMFS